MSGNGNAVASLRRQSTVVASGRLPNGDIIAQSVTLEHDPSAPSSVLIGQVFNLLRQAGGLAVDNVDGKSMDFYPFTKFDKVTFEVKSIVLAPGNSLVQ